VFVKNGESSIVKNHDNNNSSFVLHTSAPSVPTSACCMMAMTSGSTGKPKAIVVSHLSTIMSLSVRWELFPFDDDSVVASNIFFIWEVFRAPLQGKPVHIIPDDVLLDPKRFCHFLNKCQATEMVVTAQLTKNILNYPSLNLKESLKHMKRWYLCGEVCPRSMARQWNERVLPSSELWNYYSTWESLDVSYTRLSPPPERTDLSASQFACVGLPMPNVCIYVVDPFTLEPVKQGVVGEVYIGSRGASDGYFNDIVRTNNAFVPNPFTHEKFADPSSLFVSHWGEENHATAPLVGQNLSTLYKTGDRGRLLENGELELAGRDGNIVKIRGFKVGLLMVENAILSFGDVVKSCFVLPVLDPETKQPHALVAYVVGPHGQPSNTQCEQLLKRIRAKVPSYAVPEFCVGLSSFPTRPGSGKMDKKKLPPPEDGVRASSVSSGSKTGANVGSGGSPSDQIEKVITSVWTEILGEKIQFSSIDNFFEVGGHSLKAATLVGMLTNTFGLSLSVVDLYSAPTVRGLANLLRDKLGKSGSGSNSLSTRSISSHHNVHSSKKMAKGNNDVMERVDVAVIGMAGKFPGANDIDTFWNNLKDGVDSLRTLTEEELIQCNVPINVRSHAEFVPKGQMIDHPDQFDAYFWGVGKEEAKTMDPQQRLFLQVCWHAMENAGYPPRSGSNFETGVYASCGIDGYLLNHLNGGQVLREGTLDPASIFKTEVGNEKDYIATRVSYHLNLGGPSYTINSACSSGLVSVAEAVNAIQEGRCDVAIAGASSLTFPNTGYLYSEGLVASPDGKVRPFDQKAGGTVFGDGVGAVVLKRLDDAKKDGDRIMAVVRGAAVTNDGRDKAG
jgi:acyl-coenzyme A synthetase/AMP-(fatty) acid ligase/acyl carrier protein